MPELPEVETVKRGLAPAMEGALIKCVELRRQNLRYPFPRDFVSRLEGKHIVSLSRRAKYLLADTDSDDVLVMHLGMSGSFRMKNQDAVNPTGSLNHERNNLGAHDHVIFHLEKSGAGNTVTYNDPRRFGYMTLVSRGKFDSHPFFASLGIEPTGNALDGECISQLFQGRKTLLKATLLDQRIIAGLGNIYVCEALWRSGLSPKRKASTLCRKGGKATKRSELLAESVRDVIAEAIDAGGSSLRDHRQTDGSLGYFQHHFNVYDRENMPCMNANCSGTIKRIVQSGRSTFYCPSCQR